MNKQTSLTQPIIIVLQMRGNISNHSNPINTNIYL
jgi:hypothetical protein